MGKAHQNWPNRVSYLVHAITQEPFRVMEPNIFRVVEKHLLNTVLSFFEILGKWFWHTHNFSAKNGQIWVVQALVMSVMVGLNLIYFWLLLSDFDSKKFSGHLKSRQTILPRDKTLRQKLHVLHIIKVIGRHVRNASVMRP